MALADDDDALVEDDHLPSPSTSLSGFSCIIHYRDTKGADTMRRVTVIRYERAAEIDYLRAYCHEREKNRQFRVDRIIDAFDIETGEVFDIHNMLASTAPSFEQTSGLNWGLSPKCRADMVAGLNILVFVARCDGRWHPLEEEVIERFISSYWIRREFNFDPPIDDILQRVRKLRPDAETFFGGMLRALDCNILRTTIRRTIADVVNADGRIADEEFYWGHKVDEFFARNAG
jgi:uncharacterized tellurite resistance protein B-like protein